MSFVETAKLQWAEEDIPNAIIDFFKSDVFSCTADADVDPLVVPSDPTVLADEASLVAIGIFEWGDLVGHGP